MSDSSLPVVHRPQPQVDFAPVVTATRLPDGRWEVRFDWGSSLLGEFLPDHAPGELRHDEDTPLAQEASRALDQWVAKQLEVVVIPGVEERGLK